MKYALIVLVLLILAAMAGILVALTMYQKRVVAEQAAEAERHKQESMKRIAEQEHFEASLRELTDANMNLEKKLLRAEQQIHRLQAEKEALRQRIAAYTEEKGLLIPRAYAEHLSFSNVFINSWKLPMMSAETATLLNLTSEQLDDFNAFLSQTWCALARAESEHVVVEVATPEVLELHVSAAPARGKEIRADYERKLKSLLTADQRLLWQAREGGRLEHAMLAWLTQNLDLTLERKGRLYRHESKYKSKRGGNGSSSGNLNPYEGSIISRFRKFMDPAMRRDWPLIPGLQDLEESESLEADTAPLPEAEVF